MSSAPKANQPPSPLQEELLRHLPLYKKALWFSLIVNLLVLAPTWFMLEVYDRVVNSRNATTLVMLLVAVIAAFVVMELLEVVRSEIMHRAARTVDEKLRMRLFSTVFEANLRRLPIGTTQLFTDLKTVREFLASPAIMAMMDAPASLVFLVLVFIISPWLGVMALMGAFIQVVIALRTEKRTMPALVEANRAAIEAQSYANKTLRNAQVIEAMGMLGSIHQRWMGLQHRYLGLQAQASDHAGLNTATSKLVQTLQGSLLLGAACWLTLKGGMLGGGGMMLVASILGARVLAPITQLVAQWRLVVNARDARQRLDAALSAFPDKKPGMPLPAPKGHLTVETVVAAAPGGQIPIIRGANFEVKPGELLVMIGPSAAGKTTMARLLVGVWGAASGKVRLDGADVHAWNKDELGPHLGYLPQAVELFDGSIADNIARFGDVDMDQVRAAAAAVGLNGLIESLPDGYESRIGDDGAFLSGGQRQRVGLARAIYGDPQLLVLDEPNASLDEAGEQSLLAVLSQLKARGATVVVISHRSNLLTVADKLLVLRDGQVALFGPKDEVMEAMQKAAKPAPKAAHKPKVGHAVAVAGGAA